MPQTAPSSGSGWSWQPSLLRESRRCTGAVSYGATFPCATRFCLISGISSSVILPTRAQSTNTPRDWYGCEVRYCPPGSSRVRPQRHDVDTIKRELFALGTAIYEIVEWKVPYGSETEVLEDEVIAALEDGKWPQMTYGNPAAAIILRCWGYMYKSSLQVVGSFKSLLQWPHT